MAVRSWLTDLLNGGIDPQDHASTDLERTRMVNIGLLTMLAIGIPFTIQYMVLGVWLMSAAVAVTCLSVVVVMALIRRRVSITLCGFLAAMLTYALLVISNLNSGGFYDPNFAWLYVVPLVGAVLVNARAAVLLSGLVIATTIVFWGLDEAGVVIPNNIPGDMHPIQSLFNRLSALIGMGVLITLFVRSHARTRREAHRLAHFDELTGLPNRRALMRRLDKQIASGRGQCALLFVDLDRFKTVNDSLGHRAGDQLLAAIAKEISTVVDAFDKGDPGARFVARFGGDEFAIVAGGLRTRDEARQLGKRIVTVLNRPVNVEGYQLHSGASVGIALCPRDGSDADELLRSADLAMYQAKKSGGMKVAFCNQELLDSSRRWIEVDDGLQRAISADELSLVYDPIFDLETREITAVEAQLRWRRANGEVVSPGEFIPVAEATGAILDIGEWMLRQALASARQIFYRCDAPIRLSVNVSLAQLRSGELSELLIKLVEDSELPPGWLELELSESLLLEDYRQVTELMNRLGERGVEFAIDDFGAGYSSLSYLAGLPANRLKVDRDLVANVTRGSRQREVTNAIFAMAERLELPTVAEGVDSAEAAALVQSLGCTEGQGSFFSQPLSLDALLATLTSPMPHARLPSESLAPASAASSAASSNPD